MNRELILDLAESINDLEDMIDELSTCSEGANEILAAFKIKAMNIAAEFQKSDLERHRMSNNELGQDRE